MKDDVQIANKHRKCLSDVLVPRKANDVFQERTLLHTVQLLLRILSRLNNDEDMEQREL